MRVADHARQLKRLANDIKRTNVNSEALGALKALGYIMFGFEAAALGFGIYHFASGEFFITALAIAIEIGAGVLHAAGMHFERRLHENNRDDVKLRTSECRKKASDLSGAVAAFNLRPWRP
ncbi:hypothetical protein IVA98_29000 [Bradyrhizobium sp. 160]|uniref:hypothetical protein n=1 Tax=Bradyrhizobium sp. 160 TaxID=2782634 RepID=UPI001FFAF1AF|nr:hypothetical protein [Bradyrhizobium sp. 160]MCK1627094.1 hypothetical protein [Bradyrhizobium sp. 160]